MDSMDTFYVRLTPKRAKRWSGWLQTVRDGLLQQGCRATMALNHNIRCMYRGPNGTRCAAGQLIPDDLYSPDMENKPFAEILMLHSALRRELGMQDTTDAYFLDFLQNRLHDMVEDLGAEPETYRAYVRHLSRAVAAIYGLRAFEAE